MSVILNVDEGRAYIQNADTNAYLEGRFENIDVSGPINDHNTSAEAHSDIRTAVSNAASAAAAAQSAADAKAPKAHAVNATTYGIGTSGVYGHVKISDKTDSTSAASAGIAASPAAVKAAYDLAASKAPAYYYGTTDITAGSASSDPEGSLRFVIE